jgi:hypothetical protein
MPHSTITKQQITSNMYLVNDWRNIPKYGEDIWIVNKVPLQISKYVIGTPESIKGMDSSSGYQKSFESDTFKVVPKWYPGRKYSNFEMTPLWLQIQLAGYEKTHG